MAWLTGFNNRLKLTVQPDNVDSSLTDFPVMVYLSSDSGKNSFDATAVFDELGDANQKGIAITKNDGTTQCPVEIEYWDATEEKAVLWTKIPTVYSSVDTDFYLYYDATYSGTTVSGNTDYVGDINDTTYQMVINIGAEGTYDTLHVRSPCVIKESDTSYKMWYAGNDGANWRILYAVSTDGISWTGHQMVLNYNTEGTYDTVNVFNPYVIKESDTSYKMWYAGSTSANNRILYATSTNGTTWANHQMVVNIGVEGTYDTDHVISPCVIKESDTSYKMWYAGYDHVAYRGMYATSVNGTTWSGNSMIINIGAEGTYDTTNIQSPCVIKESDTSYKMWYSGQDATNYRILYATSTNGVIWGNFEMVLDIKREGTYDTSFSYTPFVLEDDLNRMWYAGFDGVNIRIIHSTYWKNPAQDVWDDNFVGVWHMAQDPSGGTRAIKDSTFNTNNGTSAGSMTIADLVDGKIGKAIDFDGVDDFIDVGDVTILDGETACTFEVILNRTAYLSDGVFIRKWAPGQQSFSFGQGIIGSSQIRMSITDTGALNMLTGETTDATIANSTPVYVAGSWNGSNVLTMYENIIMRTVNYSIAGTPVSIGNTTEHLSLSGRYNAGIPDLFTTGIQDEIRISNIARSAPWIKATYHSNWDNLIVFQEEEITTNWLTDWAKRIKLTIDHTKVDTTLVDFPVNITLASGTGITNSDVTDVFDTLTFSGTLMFSDTCVGVFGNKWIDNSNGDSYAEYNSGKLSLDLNNGGDTEAVNTVTQDSFACSSFYTFEFDWWPTPAASWFDDDLSDACNDIKIVTTSPTYNTASWNYSRCEDGVGVNSYISLYLRSSTSNLLTVIERVNGANNTLINTAFTYDVFHHVKWEVDFDNYIMNLYMDGVLISENISWNSSVLTYIGSSFKYNFHWHSYSKTDNQKYDNLYLYKNMTSSLMNKKKIAITTEDGTTQCPVEIERWDADNKEANLWTKVPVVDNDEDTILCLYYDSTKSDNNTYVGDTGSSPAQNVWDDNFVGVWHMAQDPNGDVANAIKNSTSAGINATPAGTMISADLVDGKIGKAIDFDGSDDYIYTPSADDVFNITDTLTVECIFNPTSTLDSSLVDGAGLVAHQHIPNAAQDSYAFIINNTGKLLLGTFGGNIQSTTASWSNLSWHYVVGTYNSSGLTGDLFANGVKEVLTVDNYDTMAGATNSLVIGDSDAGAAQSFPGVMDEVRVSNVVRSDEWIKATYHSNWNTLITYGSEQTRPIFLFNGYVQVEGVPAARVVCLYRRSTGELMGITISSSSNGYFEVGSNYNEYHFVVILPELTETYNLLSYDKIHPEI